MQHKALGSSEECRYLDRKSCIELASRMAQSAATSGELLSAFWVDLSRMNQINESFGHSAGDAYIAEIAYRLQNCSSNRVVWGRVGGDEFLGLILNNSPEESFELARELLRAIETPFTLNCIDLHPTASIGMATLNPGENVLSLLENADRAMHLAKGMGGGKVIRSEASVPKMSGTQEAQEELIVESKIHFALDNGGLALHYQPIIGNDGKIEAVEALMRCTVNGESIPPARFIPIAEKTNLIIRLGEWSLMVGAGFAAQMEAAGYPTKVAINVSRAQLIEPRFSQVLHAALLCANVSPKFLELELTESLFMDASEHVQNNLAAARAAGVGLAIDDFGTGYSCLATLKDIPATKLKLDRAFVKVLPEDTRAFSVVKAMASLGRALGMKVVAEGVEGQAQLDALRETDVDAIQGYFHARPMSDETMLEWLKGRNNK